MIFVHSAVLPNQNRRAMSRVHADAIAEKKKTVTTVLLTPGTYAGGILRQAAGGVPAGMPSLPPAPPSVNKLRGYSLLFF